jgi:hypothetical protein
MGTIRILAVSALALIAIGLPDISPAEQSRDACNACCQRTNTDEFYLEQCRLKCHRNHDSCTGKAATKETEPAAPPAQPAARQQPPMRERPAPAPPTPQPVTREQPAPPPVGPNPGYAGPAQPQPQPSAKPKYNPKTMLRFPSPLNLVPGKEAEAAGQILALNGVPPQHPAYPSALRAIEQVLVNFARNNPSGGQLPTSELERIFGQIR